MSSAELGDSDVGMRNNPGCPNWLCATLLLRSFAELLRCVFFDPGWAHGPNEALNPPSSCHECDDRCASVRDGGLPFSEDGTLHQSQRKIP